MHPQEMDVAAGYLGSSVASTAYVKEVIPVKPHHQIALHEHQLNSLQSKFSVSVVYRLDHIYYMVDVTNNLA